MAQLSTPQDARRALPLVSIAGRDVTDALAPWLLGLEYSDHAHGKADEVRLTLHDRDGRWRDAWWPGKGTAVAASIRCLDWTGPGAHLTLRCGSFTVDEVEIAGPPDKIAIKAVSASTSTSLREEAHTQAWENTSLRAVAGDIAGRGGLSLSWDGPEHAFTRLDQREESDLAFLQRACEERGLNLKIHDGKLVAFSGRSADARTPSLTISRAGDLFSPSSWSFTCKSQTTFKACEVAWLDPETRELRTWTYAPEGDAPSEQLLRLNQRVESQADAERLAQAELRKRNKEIGRAHV